MSEKIHGLPKAKVQKSMFNWFLWLLPLGAVAVCVSFIVRDVIFSGPTITIYFQSVDGLQAQNSFVKYLGVNVGEITDLKLAKDKKHVAIKAQLYGWATDLARQGSIFWIVRPELKLGSISGLRTIVSGTYVTVQPGSGTRTNKFTGVEEAPVPPVQALEIYLLSPDLGSLQKESPIFYRGIQVGEVLNFRLADDARNVIVHARIRQEYAPLVRVDSEFWNAGGINIHFGLFSGAQISAESAQTLVSGGIAFATPPDFGDAATNGSIFQINEKEDDSWKDWNPAIPLHTQPVAKTKKSALPVIHSR
ncbi:MAG: MlaD family protein [Limisphaerales bacterium]